jgi:hypothetical protein
MTPKFEHPAPSYEASPSPRFTVENIRPHVTKIAPLDKHNRAENDGMWGKPLVFINDLVTPSGPDARTVQDDIIDRGVVSSDEARELTRMYRFSLFILKRCKTC